MSTRPLKRPRAPDAWPADGIPLERLFVDSGPEFVSAALSKAVAARRTSRVSRRIDDPMFKLAVEQLFGEVNARLARRVPGFSQARSLQPVPEPAEPYSLADFERELQELLDDIGRTPCELQGQRTAKVIPFFKVATKPLPSSTGKRRVPRK